MKYHNYTSQIKWTGNTGQGTKNYKSYKRDFKISIAGKYKDIKGSSDPAFLGDVTKYNPEDLLLSSIASCHMLWYLHLCSEHGIIVLDYIDNCSAIMQEDENGSGRFKEVTLHPIVTILSEEFIEQAKALHAKANTMCFIANSCNFSIAHQPTIVVKN